MAFNIHKPVYLPWYYSIVGFLYLLALWAIDVGLNGWHRFGTYCIIFYNSTINKWEQFQRKFSVNKILKQWEKLKRKIWMKIILTIIGPFYSLVTLYYEDILSDVIIMITLYGNCHYKYFGLSVAILITSYFTTVLYLRFNLNETWRRAVFYHIIHVKYYILQIRRNFNAIWREGEELPEELEKETNFVHNLSFLEVTSESIPELCLQVRERSSTHIFP